MGRSLGGPDAVAEARTCRRATSEPDAVRCAVAQAHGGTGGSRRDDEHTAWTSSSGTEYSSGTRR